MPPNGAGGAGSSPLRRVAVAWCAPAWRRDWHTGRIQTEHLREPLSRFSLASIDPARILIVLALIVASLFVWSLARDRIVTPFDDLVTERLCLDHGETIEREAVGHERSNRFGLSNRSEGFCSFGEGPNGEAPITKTIAETEPGLLYRAAKWIGIIVQLGIVSIFLRLTIDPALDVYRYLRSWSS